MPRDIPAAPTTRTLADLGRGLARGLWRKTRYFTRPLGDDRRAPLLGKTPTWMKTSAERAREAERLKRKQQQQLQQHGGGGEKEESAADRRQRLLKKAGRAASHVAVIGGLAGLAYVTGSSDIPYMLMMHRDLSGLAGMPPPWRTPQIPNRGGSTKARARKVSSSSRSGRS